MLNDCPICEGTVNKVVSSETFSYKGKTKVIDDYITYRCEQCGEEIVDKGTLRKSGKMLRDFQRQVDGMLTGSAIKEIRKKLALSQEVMGEILGGGQKAFAKYESGQVCQSRAMDNLLRILDRYPIVINVILKKKKPDYQMTNVVNLSDYIKRYKIKPQMFDTKIKELNSGT